MIVNFFFKIVFKYVISLLSFRAKTLWVKVPLWVDENSYSGFGMVCGYEKLFYLTWGRVFSPPNEFFGSDQNRTINAELSQY